MGGRALKIISCVLAVALLLSFPPLTAKADSSGLTFTAINDKFAPLSMMPVYSGGSRYLPISLFSTYFGISYEYFAGANSVTLTKGSNMLIFNLGEGTCYTPDGQDWPAKATTMNGSVYVTAGIGGVFGLNYSTITGTGYGDIYRITDGSQTLSNALFADAATNSLKSLYSEYYGASVPSTSTPTPEPSESPEIEGAEVYLSFVGMPAGNMLDVLKSNNAYAAFFLSADEIGDNPDTVRRIIGEGHTVGIYYGVSSEAEAEVEEAVTALEDAAMYRPTMITSQSAESGEAAQYAQENGFVYYLPSKYIPQDAQYASVLTSQLPKNKQVSDFCLFSGENAQAMLPYVLQYFRTNGYTAPALLEINV